MSFLEILGIFAGLTSGSSYIPYVRDIFLKKTKPERASWAIWMVLTAIAFFSQLAKGASYSLWLPALETTGITIVVILSIWRGVGGATKRDIFVLCAAALGLILWYFTKEPAVALYIIIGVDAIGTIPTVIKSYQQPETETLTTWAMVAVAGVLGMLAVGQWNIILLSYPFYIFLANSALVVAMILGRKKKSKK